jgi:hypothetical protein
MNGPVDANFIRIAVFRGIPRGSRPEGDGGSAQVVRLGASLAIHG